MTAAAVCALADAAGDRGFEIDDFNGVACDGISFAFAPDGKSPRRAPVSPRE
jgi:hypothetical protein